MGLKRKKKHLSSLFFCHKRPPAHTKRYKLYHHYLQNKEYMYDNDNVEIFYEQDEEELYIKDKGINKRSYILHDPYHYDGYKDGE